MTLPISYRWLTALGLLPRTISEALKEYGTLEAPGDANNPQIIGWARQVGGSVAETFKADSIPWCGLFVALICQRAGKALPANPLWALNWKQFGVSVGQPQLGDVLIFIRPGGGHVGFYVGEDQTAYHVLGGNQSDAVTIARVAKSRLHAVRRPAMKAAPASARPYIIAASGELSTNEA
jgi:uncharacterized protein (TIGR02594 family)